MGSGKLGIESRECGKRINDIYRPVTVYCAEFHCAEFQIAEILLVLVLLLSLLTQTITLTLHPTLGHLGFSELKLGEIEKKLRPIGIRRNKTTPYRPTLHSSYVKTGRYNSG